MSKTDFVLRLVGAASAVAGLFLAGYWLGHRDAAQAERAAKAALDYLAETNTSAAARPAVDAALAAAERGDFAEAATALASNIQAVSQAECYPSGIVFAATAGAVVRNCETEMTASIASINANATLIATLGGVRSNGNPGHAFAHPDPQFANCFLVYLNLERDAKDPTARLNFDCPS